MIMRNTLLGFIVAVSLADAVFAADVIPTARRPPSWEANVATGVIGGIPSGGWTVVTLDDVAPGNTAAANTTAIQTAVAGAADNTVLLLPSGTIPANQISFATSVKSNVVIRGAGMFTTILQSASSGAAIVSGGDPAFQFGPSAVVSGLTRGQTTISVVQIIGESAQGFTAGSIVYIAPNNDWEKPVTGYNNVNNIRVIYAQLISAVNTGGDNYDLTIGIPIPADYPEGAIIAQVAHGGGFGSATHVNIGLEDLTIDCQSTATTGWHLQGNHYGCWAKNVWIKNYVTNGLWVQFGAQFEANTVLVTHSGTGTGTRASFHFGDVTGLLAHNCIGLGSLSGASGLLTQGPMTSFAPFGSFFMDGGNYVNHIGAEQFNMFEGNGFSCLQHDNFHQSGSEASFVRNTFFGLNGYGNWNTTTGYPTTGWVSTESVGLPPGYAAKRWSRNFTLAKNRFGMTGFVVADADNLSIFGYPNIGNADYYGSASLIGTGGASPWQDWDTSANGGDGGTHVWTGTVASRSDFNGSIYESGVFTISGGNLTVLDDRIDTAIANFTWTGNTVSFWVTPAGDGSASIAVSTGTLSGTALTINGLNHGAPDVATPVTVTAGPAGFQERDLDVEATSITADNRTEDGTLIYNPLDGGTTVQDSYVWPNGAPSYWSGYAWPPNIQTLKDFPAGQNYLTFLDTGSFNPTPPPASGGDATVSGTTTVTDTLTVP